MGKVIIGIHGLGNKPDKDILTAWWKQSILEGLKRIGYRGDHIRFEMVYWADVFYPAPLDPLEDNPEDPLFLEEIYSPGTSPVQHDPHTVRRKLLDILEDQMDNVFLNEDLSINFSFLSDSIIRKYFTELDSYYALELSGDGTGKPMARDVIRERLATLIHKYQSEEIMVIGHSMGSIIAYDVLTFSIPDVEIDTFITIGSPLGLPVVMAKIAAERNIRLPNAIKLKTPPSVTKHWFNFSDLEDRIALIYDLTDDYDPNFNGVKIRNFVVENDYAINGKRNPHKSFGYLRTKEVAGAIGDFLGITGGNALARLFGRLRKQIRSIFGRNR